MSGFVCAVRDDYRPAHGEIDYLSACDKSDDSGPIHYARGYCVLHFPGSSKQNNPKFQNAIQGKLTKKDYNFAGAYFPGFQSFASREFTETTDPVRFSGAVFVDGADFSNVIFGSEARFYKARFGKLSNEKDAVFSYATFKKDASFVGTQFQRNAYFSWATFEKEADFSDCRCLRNAYFYRTIFQESARFYSQDPVTANIFNTREVVDFRFVQIKEPDWFHFYSLRLRPSWFINMDARKPNFTDVEWYAIPGGVEGSRAEEINELERRRDEGDTQIQNPHALLGDACRELSLNYEDNHNYEKANAFYYLAQEAERIKGPSRGFNPLRLRWWYWLLSGYSVKPFLAFLWIVIAWLGFLDLYMWWLQLDVGQAASFSTNAVTRQRVPGLDAASATAKSLNEDNLLEVANLFVAIEGIIGPLLIALLVLALRRRFMR